jgi:hypothetical protein
MPWRRCVAGSLRSLPRTHADSHASASCRSSAPGRSSRRRRSTQTISSRRTCIHHFLVSVSVQSQLEASRPSRRRTIRPSLPLADVHQQVSTKHFAQVKSQAAFSCQLSAAANSRSPLRFTEELSKQAAVQEGVAKKSVCLCFYTDHTPLTLTQAGGEGLAQIRLRYGFLLWIVSVLPAFVVNVRTDSPFGPAAPGDCGGRDEGA